MDLVCQILEHHSDARCEIERVHAGHAELHPVGRSGTVQLDRHFRVVGSVEGKHRRRVPREDGAERGRLELPRRLHHGPPGDVVDRQPQQLAQRGVGGDDQP
ncbi:MAG: hypothetical protein M5U19_12105 [Microthrixaceae bacterium]|nr:hypothetical protein [Microthrixaceae bacterium]